MNKKIDLLFLLSLLAMLSACGGIKKQYVVVSQSHEKPSWIDITRDTDELKKKFGGENEYVVSDAESINKTICEKESKAKGPVAFKEQITQSIQEQFSGKYATDEQESNVNAKISKSVNAVAGRITGVKVKDSYWELRQNVPDKGADDDKKFYHCNTLFSMDSKKLNSLKDTVYKIYEKEIKESGEQSIKNDFIDLKVSE
ncbi:MAG: hypothetical protein LBC92_03950 [Rickettsiales bacterium]|nr:hypothetical protein [Rickettsiales bacterium]